MITTYCEEERMFPRKEQTRQATKRVPLISVGQHQFVPVPKGFELEAVEVNIRRTGNRLVVESVSTNGLLALLARLEPIPEDFPDVDAGLGVLDSQVLNVSIPMD
ncbi:MAG: hypothetical protein LRY53_09530 [Burkholderiaceae bacterium]|nr:hypothetical protein [Burkholderiaceae bacterium]MCD8515940.1 hypothetical protein [Burkholderiaceae bacterium]MCD8538193.1 hypothetical protein [Burkholderiaceae bacterium]MCD8565850.1 hypothetical protein [Burkholderiaceae bacterium]